MTRSFIHTYNKTTAIALLFIIITGMWSCSKSTENFTPAVQPPTTVNPPTGVIESFILTDTLVAFNTGSTAKWLVTGTNLNSVITFNGVIVGNYGVLDTGPLKQNSTFTLAVNNGKQASVSLKVADSITTLLWNKGKRLRQTKFELYLVRAGQTDPLWVDTPMTARVIDQRIYFSLDGTSRIYQSNANANVSPPDAGRFIVNVMQGTFTWLGNTYLIGSLDNNELKTSYDIVLSNGRTVRARNTYAYE